LPRALDFDLELRDDLRGFLSSYSRAKAASSSFQSFSILSPKNDEDVFLLTRDVKVVNTDRIYDIPVVQFVQTTRGVDVRLSSFLEKTTTSRLLEEMNVKDAVPSIFL
jgi:hypothetical protein